MPQPALLCLTYQGGAAWRKRLLDDIGDQGAVSKLIEGRSDEELALLMTNLGGHDLPTLIEAFEQARAHDRPVCFIAYTVKGFGLPLAGHKDNHAGLMTAAQVEELRAAHAVRSGREWEPFEGLPQASRLADFVRNAPFNAKGRRRYASAHVDVPAALNAPLQPQMSTQQGFGLIMHEIGKQEG